MKLASLFAAAALAAASAVAAQTAQPAMDHAAIAMSRGHLTLASLRR